MAIIIRNFFLLLSIAAITNNSSAQTNATSFTTPGGMVCQLFSGQGARQVRAGEYVKILLTQKINDSVIYTSAGALPLYQAVPKESVPYDISEIWTRLKLGDSLIATQLMDTFLKKNPDNIPPQFKKGDKILTQLKLLAIFENDSLAKADYDRENKEWLAQEIITIGKYLSEKKITAKRTPSGAYIQIIKPGTGNLIDSGKQVTVNYTGTTFSGKVFDSNTDPSFGHVEPYSFGAGEGQMIKGFDEAVLMMRKGGSARVWIPSLLGYGAYSGSPDIQPFEHLIFDIEIVDLKAK